MRIHLVGVTLLSVGASCSYLEDATTVPVDYDVDLIEPVEFDGSQAVAPASVDVAVSDTSPTTEVTISNADKWGPMLALNKMAEDAGMPRIFTIRSSAAPTFTGVAPVTFDVDVSSADGNVWGADLNAEPVSPASCSFTLDPVTAAADDFGIALEDCIVDWAAQNGTPSQLAVAITTTSAAAATGGSTYDFQSLNTMSTTDPVEADCDAEIALDDSVTDRIDSIEFDAIQLDAVGAANDPVVVAWVGYVFDSNGTRVASGSGFEALGGGDSVEFHAEIASAGATPVITGDADVNLSPVDAAGFLEATINALSGKDTGAPGIAAACWYSFGATPRSGSLAVSIEGVARAGAI